MTREFFERHYGLLSDKADASQVFGNSIEAGVATVGDIRRKLEGHTKAASVCPESDGSGLCVTELQRKAFASYLVDSRRMNGLSRPK